MSATPETVKLFLGPIYVGTIVSTCLFGVCASQFTTYFLSARRLQDSLSVRALVLWELLISIFCSATSVYFVWLYLVDNYFNPGFMAFAPWPLAAVPMLSVLSACPVQIFMAYRVFSLSKSYFLFGLLILLTIANVGIALATSVLAFGFLFADGSQLTPQADSWLAITVVNDLSLTLSLMYYLHQYRTGFTKTDTVIRRLMRSALESAAFATFFSIMILIMFTVLPKTGLHLMFSQPMGRIYTSTLLSTLNARETLRDSMGDTFEFGESGVDVTRFHVHSNPPDGAPVAVKITVDDVTDTNRLHRTSKGDKPTEIHGSCWVSNVGAV
ncbi:hypothetical protein DFH08DRAFT_1088175 [Mycena albidolilacea]|uniref:DUF6534 domain-containing protein n=1 Tax=Mycena albidolilacea TaxID=1033008 RepID=A0AAD6Z6D2_9AGAR|nr:hypothetical protein DFH08DRAFT_1088175 [Mycena albidolilacea]